MPTFAQKPKAIRRTASAKSAMPGRGHLAQIPEASSILYEQGTTGYRAVRRMLHTDAQDAEAGSSDTSSAHYGHAFSRIPVHPPVAGAIQTKLAINKPGDEFEQEADRVAERVMSTPEPQLQRACSCGTARRESGAEQSGRERESLQTQRVQAGDMGQMTAPPIVHEVLRAPGLALDAATRAFMETRVGYDFSGVRVHTDERAVRSAREIDANAYTVGSHVVFGAGQFAPGSAAGRRLLAHELTHVVQQTAAGAPSLQRDEPKGAAKDKDASQQAAPAKPEPGTAYFHIVVRDRGLDLGGGVLVSDLAAAKTTLMNRKIDKPWTLVLAVHASENRLGAQSPPDWQKNAIFYDDAAINSLFGGDAAFVAWRDQFGPNRVVLYGCQVTAAFEQTIANNLARGGKAPSAVGLGEGCKPLSTEVTFGVSSRRAYDKLGDTDKEKVLGEVQAANTTWGYYGGPPVPNDQVLDYLFKGPKPGSWPQVEVIVKQGDDYVSTKPPIPYWNRLSNSTYLRQCTKAVGNLREHKPQAPTVRESE